MSRSVVAKINDPVRAEAYAHLGIARICRTNLMVDALLGFLGSRRRRQPGHPVPRAAAPHRLATCRAERRRRTRPPAAPAHGHGGLTDVRLVVGGGKVGYYLAKELHRVRPRGRPHGEGPARARPRSPTRSGRIVIAATAARASTSSEAGANRADIVAAVTGDDEDNLVICQMAKHHFDVPRTIARVNNPKNEALFRHLGVDEIISATRMILGSIEQDIPVHELLHLAALGGGELEIIEAHLQPGSPAIGRVADGPHLPTGARSSR